MIPINNSLKNRHEYFDVVEPIITHHINRIFNDRGIYKGVGKSKRLVPISIPMKKLMKLLLNRVFLQKLVFASFDQLEIIVGQIINKHYNSTVTNNDDNLILRNIFVEHAYKGINRDWLIDNVGTDTCPYCNRNYIYKINKANGTNIVRAQLDHFYPKNKYPLLAVTVFNLVPSCQNCNGRNGKHEIDPFHTGIISPYKLKYSDFLFTFKFSPKNQTLSLSKMNVEVLFSKTTGNNADLFNLHEYYKKHNDHVSELIMKKELKYGSKYRTYLKKQIGIHFNNNDLDRFILSNYSKEEDVHKRPLAKMYQDIGIELGLIKSKS